MSNLPALPDAAPQYLADLIASNPAFAAANESALANMFGGMHPMIGINGTRFIIKDGGEAVIITDPRSGQPIGTLGCVVLAAKPQIEKKCYLTPYNPDSSSPPDCQSMDGIKPDPNSPAVQNPTCAGCWANVFGSGVNQDGTPSKGKKCADLKKLAIFANGKIYGFYVPPGSLQNFTAFVKDLTARQLPLPAVITGVGFDLKTPQILTFNYMGMLDPVKQLPKVVEMCNSDEVKEIIEWRMATTQQIENKPPAAQETQEAAAAAATTAAAKTPSRTKGAAAAKTKETPQEPAKTEGAEAQLDLGFGGEEATGAVQETVAASGPSDDDIAAALFS